MWIVTILFWLQAFAGPVILFGLIGLAVGNHILICVLLAIGAVTGIIFAEHIRRRFGLDTFFGRIYGPNEMDDKLKKNTDEPANGPK